MTYSLIRYECVDSVATIGLDRAAKRNALSDGVMDELADAAVRAEREAKVGVVYGVGDHFSAGLDLREAASWVEDPMERQARRRDPRSRRRFDELARSSIPFVAAISGACVGGGLEVAASCHLRVADETAFFALPEGSRGIYLGGGGSVRITKLIGVARMTDMMLTGRTFNAEEAERCNLVNYVVPAGSALAKATSLAERISQNAPAVNWAVSTCLPRISDYPYDDGLFAESLVLEAVMSQSPGSRDRLLDFLDSRAKPDPAQPATNEQ
jgi:enoyl-CoA hydratase/carnithine racemase